MASIGGAIATAAYFHFLNGIAILFLGITWLFSNTWQDKFERVKSSKLIWLPIAYFMIQVVSMLLSNDASAGWYQVEKKLSFFIIPLLLFSGPAITQKSIRYLMLTLLGSTVAGSLFLLINAVLVQFLTGETTQYFYHDLVMPYGIHAVYFSLLVATSVFVVLESLLSPIHDFEQSSIYRIILFLTLVILCGMLILLSSKMIVAVFSLILLFYSARHWLKRKNRAPYPKKIWIGLVLIVAILFSNTGSHLWNRFKEVTDTTLITQGNGTYTYDSRLNGLTLRLIIWEQSLKVVREQNAHLLGVGNGDFQYYLDNRYKEIGLYTGNPDLGDSGYLGYNSHSQFVQELLCNGMLGLSLVLLLYGTILIKSRKVDFSLLAFSILFVFLSISESALQRQAGIVLFVLLFSLSAIAQLNPEADQ